MAGPNGGPPRRSHTKSRKGCDTCKKRHIRCDESFPQCKNCTKHKVRCPYNDLTVTEDRCPGSPGQPDLLWTADVRQAVQMWKHEGVFPIQDWPAGLRTPDPTRHSAQSLRLIYHLASTYWDLRNLGANDLTLWTRHIPSLIDVASSHDYVMDALLAFSAMQISEVSRCPAAANLSSEHHLAAISGLNLAINGWSRETSDAILAANFVLSWQAKDWSNWSYFIGGTRMMISSMKEWKFDSKFLDLIDENGMASSPAPPSPKPETARFSVEDDLMVDQTLTHLQRLESTLKASKDAAMKDKAKEIQQLSNFLKGARKIGPKQSIEEQFDRLRDLRTWLFELPVTLLRNSGCQPNRLAVIAHYYTVALLMERLFPHMGGVYFGSMTIRPLHYIAQMLGQQQESLPEPLSHMANVARDVSLAAVADFTMRNDWFMLTPHTPSYSPSPYYPETNFSTSEVCLQGLGFTGPNALYGTPSFSYSQNSLPVNSSYSPVNGGSPQSMHSPYTGHGFLGVPSPYLGRAWSPVSSNFEDGQCFDGDVFLEPEFISHAPFHGRSLSAGHVYSDNRNHLVPAFASSELSM